LSGVFVRFFVRRFTGGSNVNCSRVGVRYDWKFIVIGQHAKSAELTPQPEAASFCVVGGFYADHAATQTD
jgi:hypothetical protein